jgi:hypothetical protein
MENTNTIKLNNGDIENTQTPTPMLTTNLTLPSLQLLLPYKKSDSEGRKIIMSLLTSTSYIYGIFLSKILRDKNQMYGDEKTILMCISIPFIAILLYKPKNGIYMACGFMTQEKTKFL